MKATVPLLVAVLIVGLLNLLQGFGVFGGGAGGAADKGYTYEVYSVDEVGLMIKYLIDEDFKKEGKTEYPAAILENPRITLPRLMNYMSSEGWELVEIKANGLHLFRRPIDSPLGEDGAPRLAAKAPEAGDAAPAADGADAAADAAPAPAAEAPATDAAAPTGDQ